jgi:hypothetical protein
MLWTRPVWRSTIRADLPGDEFAHFPIEIDQRGVDDCQGSFTTQVTSWKNEVLENLAGIFGGEISSRDERERIRELHA